MSPSRWRAAFERWRGSSEPTTATNLSAGGRALEARLDQLDAVMARVAPPPDEPLPEMWERPAGRSELAGFAREPRAPAQPQALDQEYDMDERLTCSAEGISELVVEALADDARIRMAAELTEIRIVAESDGWESARLVVEGERVRLAGAAAERIDLPPGVALVIDEALGDVRVKGLEAGLRIRTVEGDLRLERVTGQVDIEQLHSDALVDEVASLRIRNCGGDLRFSGGDLEAETVGGDVRVERATSVRGAKAHGDLWVEALAGNLEFGAVHGDARVDDVAGSVSLGLVAGDLRATAVRGGLKVDQAHGDAQLEGPFSSEDGYTVKANGDVDIRLSAEDSVRLSVRALGRVRANLSLTPNADGTPSFTATVGEGKAPVSITCNGDLRIDAAGGDATRRRWEKRRGPGGDPFADLSGLGDRIRQQVSDSLAAAGINPETGQVNMDLGFGKSRGGRGRPPEPPRPPSPPQPPKRGMSGEQMAVLKMLEEGRITPDEADALLRALGA